MYWTVGSVPESHHWQLAVLYMELGKWRNSVSYCNRYLEYRESSQIRSVLGYCYGSMGMWKEAARAYRSIPDIHKEPNFALGLAEAELNSGNLASAKEIVAVVEVIHDRPS